MRSLILWVNSVITSYSIHYTKLYEIRDNELKRIPYLLIVGEKEAETNSVSVRRQGEGDKGTMTNEEFAGFIEKEVREQLSGLYN